MVKDDTMKANSKLCQNRLNVLAIDTKPNNTKLAVHVLYDFITCLSIYNMNTEYNKEHVVKVI